MVSSTLAAGYDDGYAGPIKGQVAGDVGEERFAHVMRWQRVGGILVGAIHSDDMLADSRIREKPSYAIPDRLLEGVKRGKIA
jgi:hypothetical protein